MGVGLALDYNGEPSDVGIEKAKKKAKAIVDAVKTTM
jgi:hypothetical protein